MCEDVERLEIGYAEGVWEVDVDIKAKGAENALFGGEEGLAPPFVRAFGDIVCFLLLLLQIGGRDEGRGEGREVCVDVYKASW